MSKSARIGGVTAQFNEDGTLHIYQPESNRVMSQELAEQLAAFLAEGLNLNLAEEHVGRSVVLFDSDLDTPDHAPKLAEAFARERRFTQDTVPAGVVNTSEPEYPEVSGAGVPYPPVETPAESIPDPKPPIVKRRPGRPRKTT